jgi:amphi-Trp domain-containing protein
MTDDTDRKAVEDGDGANDETEYEVERTVTRDEAATLLRKLADDVESGSIAFYEGGIVADIPGTLDFEIEFEREDNETEIEIELEWPAQEEEVEDDNQDAEEKEPGDEDEKKAEGEEEQDDEAEDDEHTHGPTGTRSDR